MFRLTSAELAALNRSQIATGSEKHRDPRFPPYAFTELERKVSSHDQAIVGILKTIRELMHPPLPKKRPIGFTANLDEEP